MSATLPDHLDDLRSTVRAVVAPHLATDSRPDASLDRPLWNELEGLGLIGLAAPESVGGSGGDLMDAATVMAELVTARLPYAEAAFVAAPVLAEAGIAIPRGPLTAATGDLVATAEGLSGRAERVPYARHCGSMLLLSPAARPVVHLVALDAPGIQIAGGVNLAGEPRDSVTLAGVTPLASAEVSESTPDLWRLRAALARAVAAAGAAEAVVDLTRRHASERVQFGRPLARFQVVQHSLAAMTAEATAMQVAGTAGVLALVEDPSTAELLVAAAKAETAVMTRSLTATAHQVHGAIGFTQEHVLGALTQRLWSWRDEHGNERYWHQRLGELCAGRELWQVVTGQ